MSTGRNPLMTGGHGPTMWIDAGPTHEARILSAASKWEDFEGLCGPYNIVALVWSFLLNRTPLFEWYVNYDKVL